MAKKPMGLIRSITQGAVAGAVGNRSTGRGLLGAGMGLLATRIAMRSLPGALVVGGALVAKTLWDRKREKDRLSQVDAAFDEARPDPAGEIKPARVPRAKPRLPKPRLPRLGKAKAEPAQLPPIPDRRPAGD